MSDVLTEHFPPQPGEIPLASNPVTHRLIVGKLPLYKDLGELMFNVDGLLHDAGHAQGEQIPLRQIERGLVGPGPVISWEFIVGSKDNNVPPAVARTRFSAEPSRTPPSRSLFFAETYMYPSRYAVWKTNYRAHGAVGSGAEISRAAWPASRSQSVELITMLSHAALSLDG